MIVLLVRGNILLASVTLGPGRWKPSRARPWLTRVDSCHLGSYHCLVTGAGTGSASQDPASSLPPSGQRSPAGLSPEGCLRHLWFWEPCGGPASGWALCSGLLSDVTGTANITDSCPVEGEYLGDGWQAQALQCPLLTSHWEQG